MKNETKTDEEDSVKTVDAKTDDVELMVVTTCPVMGGEANLEGKFIIHSGNKVYFCCDGCDDNFKKVPETYIAKIKADPEKYIKDYKSSE